MSILSVTEGIGKSAHKQYLDIWELKTLVAENNGEWNQDIQHQVLEQLEKTTSSLSLLCRTLNRFMEANKQDFMIPQ